MKTIFLTIALATCLASCASFHGQEPRREGHIDSVAYTAVTFDQNKTEVRLRGRISRRQFQKWFKTDYPVAGNRIEIPAEATVFGRVTIYGDGLVVMPFYTWGDSKIRFFMCQSNEIGQAPEFSVFEQTEEDFMKSMKRKLEQLE